MCVSLSVVQCMHNINEINFGWCGSRGACLDSMLSGVQVTAGLGFFSAFKSFNTDSSL